MQTMIYKDLQTYLAVLILVLEADLLVTQGMSP